MEKIDISIVIPVYNALLNLKSLVNEIIDILKKNFKTYELILVDDKSEDNSWSLIKDLCKENIFMNFESKKLVRGRQTHSKFL